LAKTKFYLPAQIFVPKCLDIYTGGLTWLTKYNSHGKKLIPNSAAKKLLFELESVCQLALSMETNKPHHAKQQAKREKPYFEVQMRNGLIRSNSAHKT